MGMDDFDLGYLDGLLGAPLMGETENYESARRVGLKDRERILEEIA